MRSGSVRFDAELSRSDLQPGCVLKHGQGPRSLYNMIYDKWICPVSHDPLSLDAGQYVSKSGKRYPLLAEDIPVLLPEPSRAMKQIEMAQSSYRKDWYTKEQLPAYEKGPYRHHARRRKEIVTKWTEDIYAQMNNKTSSGPFTVADLGCGDGASTRWLMDALPSEAHFFLLEYNPTRLLRAHEALKRPNASFALCDVSCIPLKNETVDLAFSHHAIEHIPDVESVFSEVFRILKPGGFFLLGCPNEGVFWWLLAYALSPAVMRASDHIHFFNSDVLSEMGRKCGLRLERVSHLGYGPPHWMLDSLLRRIKLIDDIFHYLGRIFIRKQASSLYMMFRKP